MRYLFFLLLILGLFQSCNNNSKKDKLRGNWSGIPNGFVELEIYQDSLIVTEFGDYKYAFNWDIKESRLYLKPMVGFDMPKTEPKVFDFKISHNLDTLLLKGLNDSTFMPPFLKIRSAFDYIKKRKNLTIDLPKEKDLIREPDSSIGINLYVGFNKGKLVTRTDSNMSKELSDIIFLVYENMANFKDHETPKLHYNLIADKNVGNAELDSIRNILKETGLKNILRVYTNENVDYNKINWKEEIVWSGIME